MVGGLLAAAPFLAPMPASGACRMEQEEPGAPVLVRHLGPDCSDEERAALAIPAETVLSALKAGRGVDLVGVVVAGDLALDQLVPVSAATIAGTAPPALRDRLQRERLVEVRVINGPVTIRDSRVRGRLATNLSTGLLVVAGPLVMAGTTFEHTVDLSFTAFLGPVDCSGAVLLGEGFFVRALFEGPARFERTSFGPHTRFHRSVFVQEADFREAGFKGLSEFLEIRFEKGAAFSRASFAMGTGFSGSRFDGPLDFSGARFEREAFFLFTEFQQDATFRRARFHGRADFSDARFEARDDFADVLFDMDPGFERTKVSRVPIRPKGLRDPRVLYVVAAGLFALTLFLLLWGKRGKEA